MESKPTLKTARKMLCFGTPAWAAALCFAFAASCALAQTEPEQTEPKPEQAKPKPAQVKPESDKAKPEADEAKPKSTQLRPKAVQAQSGARGAKAKPKSGCGAAKKTGSKKRGGKAKLVPDPNAKWACDRTTVTLESVWRGKPLVFAFDIRNEGTADLKIKARGG